MAAPDGTKSTVAVKTKPRIKTKTRETPTLSMVEPEMTLSMQAKASLKLKPMTVMTSYDGSTTPTLPEEVPHSTPMPVPVKTHWILHYPVVTTWYT